MKIGYLGSGVWGFALANILAENGHDVLMWGIEEGVLAYIELERLHPKLPKLHAHPNLKTTTDFEKVCKHAELFVESVTTKGLRSVIQMLLDEKALNRPFVMTSKGIEVETGLLLPEIVAELASDKIYDSLAMLTGPSIALGVVDKTPTSLVAASPNRELGLLVQSLFSNSYLSIYPHEDIIGAAFGGALKNPIAIASGLCDGLGYEQNTKAALITRGLHEMRKLALKKGAQEQTINGLAGMGDLIVTCLSTDSRNYRFGSMLASGSSAEAAKETIGMVVEGALTCKAAMLLSKKFEVEMPITQAVYDIVYENKPPKAAIEELLSREVEHEWL